MNSQCWDWDRCLDSIGYGQLRIRGVKKKAHRVMFEVFVGKIPDGMCVCHKCDNRKCINPDHLFLGTHQENMLDGVLKRRFRHKVSVEEVLEIRRLHMDGFSRKDLGRMFGITRQHAGNIINMRKRIYAI